MKLLVAICTPVQDSMYISIIYIYILKYTIQYETLIEYILQHGII